MENSSWILTRREKRFELWCAMLAPTGAQAQKERGQMVMRCKVKNGSTLVDKFVKDVDFARHTAVPSLLFKGTDAQRVESYETFD